MFKVGDVVAWQVKTGMVTARTCLGRVVGVTPGGRPRVLSSGGVRAVRGARLATEAEATEVARRELAVRLPAHARVRRELASGTDAAAAAALADCLRLYGWTCTPPGAP
jgi:hypothetical protein